MSVKQIPNILSISRIVLSLFLCFFLKETALFIFLYLLIGFTDALDGFIARRCNAVTPLGAKLDSLGDLVFFIVLTLYLIIEQHNIISPYFIHILIIFFVRIVNIGIGFAKYRKLVMLHTVANKIAGFSIYLLPLILLFGKMEFMFLVLLIASIATIEETLMIVLSSKGEIDLNKKSFFVCL